MHMKLRCTIGSHGFVGGPTYTEGDEYELEDEELAKQILNWGYAEEVEEVTSSVSLPSLVKDDGKALVMTETSKKPRTRKKY
jgi:hypothetical protein